MSEGDRFIGMTPDELETHEIERLRLAHGDHLSAGETKQVLTGISSEMIREAGIPQYPGTGGISIPNDPPPPPRLPTVQQLDMGDCMLTKELMAAIEGAPQNGMEKHSHYKKDIRHLKMLDIYRILDLYGVTDPCIQHAVKKLLVTGQRGAGKSFERDIQEAIDSLNRCLQMQAENDNAVR